MTSCKKVGGGLVQIIQNFLGEKYPCLWFKSLNYPGCLGGIWVLKESPDEVPQAGEAHPLEQVHLLLLVISALHDGQQPRRALEGVRAAWLLIFCC